ncbi:UNVERIFIED_CONTAM: hypothetical protein HHA_456480 [Hammondia hammondi]|eukprot:XP_008888962.1 hypothetical protein HHA_456480 [Hammondia hammondi]
MGHTMSSMSPDSMNCRPAPPVSPAPSPQCSKPVTPSRHLTSTANTAAPESHLVTGLSPLLHQLKHGRPHESRNTIHSPPAPKCRTSVLPESDTHSHCIHAHHSHHVAGPFVPSDYWASSDR